MSEVVSIAGFFVGWFVFSVAATLLTKDLQHAGLPVSTTLTIGQFAVGTFIGFVLLRVLRIQEAQKLTSVSSMLRISAPYCFGHLLTNMSLMSGAPSFTHTVKAMEPLFTVAISMILLGTKYSPFTLLTLIPTVAGVIIASTNELSFSLGGVASVMLSNVCFAIRNVFSGGCGLDDLNLFFYVNLFSTIMLLPLFLLYDVPILVGMDMKTDMLASIAKLLVVCGVSHFLYNQMSFMVLLRTSAVTHSVDPIQGNSMRRIALIVCSVLYLGTPMTAAGVIGTAVACGGASMYAIAKSRERKPVLKKADPDQ